MLPSVNSDGDDAWIEPGFCVLDAAAADVRALATILVWLRHVLVERVAPMIPRAIAALERRPAPVALDHSLARLTMAVLGPR